MSLWLQNVKTSETNGNGFIAKYNSDGYVQWGAQIGGATAQTNEETFLRDIAIDTSNNVYVSGQFRDVSLNIYDAITKGNGGIASTPAIVLKNVHPTLRQCEPFIAKYDQNGLVLWAVQMGETLRINTSSAESAFSVVTDKKNNVYVAGRFTDPTLNIYDAITRGNNGISSPVSISLLRTAINPASYASNGFIVKYDSNGKVKWAAQLGCYYTGIGVNDTTRDISIDDDNNIYITGAFSNVLISFYDSIPAGTSGISNQEFRLFNTSGSGNPCSYTAKYDENGKVLWAYQMGSRSNYPTDITYGNSVCCSKIAPAPTPTPAPTPISNICFPKSMPIETDQGDILIEDIDPDIHTIHNRTIVAVTKTVSNDEWLVSFEKDSLGKNTPCDKTIMSKNHKLFYKGKMVEAYNFVGQFDGVKNIEYNGDILYNVLLEQPFAVKVNNLICETLHPKNLIAKLYTSNMSEQYKDSLIVMMNDSIKKRDTKKYKKVVEFIR